MAVVFQVEVFSVVISEALAFYHNTTRFGSSLRVARWPCWRTYCRTDRLLN
jgi:hypothetical protein